MHFAAALPRNESLKVRKDQVRAELARRALRPGTTAESLAALEPAFVQQGADGQDALALAAHPEAGQIRHLHTVETSPALAAAAALVLIGSAGAAKRIGVAPDCSRATWTWPSSPRPSPRCACGSAATWTPGRNG